MAVRSARVSLCMIVRDEEQHLADCLSPIAGLFDEIVIVDTGSQDNTRQIAQRFTSKVHDFPWCDDFSAARNESLRHATGDWIFWLDADDRLRPEPVARLRTLLDNDLADHGRIFLMNVMLAPPRPNLEPMVVTHVRLFPKTDAVHWEGRVHEQLQPEFAAPKYEQIFTDVQIDHIGYRNNERNERKRRRKLRLLRTDYAIDPNNPSTLLHLAAALQGSHPQEAKGYLGRLLAQGNPAYMRSVFYMLAEMALNEARPAEAAQHSARGLALFPDDEPLLFAHASALYGLQQYAVLAPVLKRIIEGKSSRHLMFATVGNVRTKLAPRLLGAVQRMQGAYREAETTLQAVLRSFPGDIITWYNLGLVHLDERDSQKFDGVVRRLLELPGGNIEAGLLAALWHLRQGDLSLAGPLIDELIALEPQAPRPRMLRVEWLSRRGASLADQQQALRDLLRIQPGNVEARHWLAAVQRAAPAPQAAAAGNWSTSVVAAPAAAVV